MACRGERAPFTRTVAVTAAAARRSGGGGGGQAAKDANGDDVKSKKWLATHLPGDRQLVQGLKARARAARPPVRVAA